MRLNKTIKVLGYFSLFSFSGTVFGHGFMESPPSRNGICGALIKPDGANAPGVQYPQCAEAFAGSADQGYNFMSVLTHHRGRLRPLEPLEGPPPANEAGGVVPPLANDVCGYDSESFGNGETLWDKPIDWPTNNMNTGRNKITWNISNGPHFDDTRDFRYWITKPGFAYQVGNKLTWDDFEEQPFCNLTYSHASPNANPDVVSRVADAKFDTYCTIPARSGRHVIYGEWGRNYFTYERFHGCIDANFGGSNPGPVVVADIDITPNGPISGAGSVALSASGSQGNNLSYAWSILSNTSNANYTISDPAAAQTTLTFTNPPMAGDVTIGLTVTESGVSSPTTATLSHTPEGAASQWKQEKALTGSARTLKAGDTVQVRIVSNTGVDSFVPNPALTLTAANAGASQWPLALAQAVNSSTSDIAVGVLNSADDTVTPTANATSNQIYSSTNASIANVFLNVTELPTSGGSGSCTFSVVNEWDNGFQGKITIANSSSSPITSWEVNWSFADGSTVVNSWNANLSGTYTASNVGWNGTIQPGESAEFGFVGAKGGSGSPTTTVTGTVCD